MQETKRPAFAPRDAPKDEANCAKALQVLALEEAVGKRF